MNTLTKFLRIFWNPSERRLRALWRLGLHTSLVLSLTTVFTIGLMALAVLLAGGGFAEGLSGAGPIQWAESSWINRVVGPLATFCGVVLATFLAGHWFDRRRFKNFGFFFKKDWWVDFGFGLALGAGLMGLVFLVGWLTGSIRVTGFFVVNQGEGGFLLGFVQALVMFVLVGFYEELLSRGYQLINLAEGLNLQRIGKRNALLLAYGITSLVFGLLHLGNPNANWVSVLNITLAGLFLGLGMVLTGSLAIPIGLHITWNFFQGNVFGFPVSGIQAGATVMATESVGPVWLTGGGFGPEAGLLGLGAMLMGGVFILWYVRRKGPLGLCVDIAQYEKPAQDLCEE